MHFLEGQNDEALARREQIAAVGGGPPFHLCDCSRVTGHPEVETDGHRGAAVSLQGWNTHWMESALSPLRLNQHSITNYLAGSPTTMQVAN